MSALHLSLSEGDHHYDIRAEVDESGVLQVEVTGCGDGGELIAQLQGTTSAADLAGIGRLFLAAAAAMPAATRVAPTVEERRLRHANSHQPWTPKEDARLAAEAAIPGATIAQLTKSFGRSRNGIKARMEKLRIAFGQPASPAAAGDLDQQPS
ncbi:hypothetical protein ACFV1N_25525 [Streptosporangium canum]|uniref:hypothetical protein n=1 Tax=Streptosporangium canum TaxID=324952 RepID=UPI0036AB8070